VNQQPQVDSGVRVINTDDPLDIHSDAGLQRFFAEVSYQAGMRKQAARIMGVQKYRPYTKRPKSLMKRIRRGVKAFLHEVF
jgi:hypothetical protein